MNLASLIESIKHRRLGLAKEDVASAAECHRPDIAVWAELDEGQPATVVLQVGSLWGQPTRFAEMLPTEARALARHLNEVADEIDRATSAAAVKESA